MIVWAKILYELSRRNRLRKADRLSELLRASQAESVLFVGLSYSERAWENQLESRLSDRFPQTVGSGLSSAPGVGWSATYVAADGRSLPFAHGSFDAVISNAVVEHVGDETAQREFVSEHVRVARRLAVVTSPNRWFPIETHCRVLFLHYLRSWRRNRSEFTRLLSRSELRALFPSAPRILPGILNPSVIAVTVLDAQSLTTSTQPNDER